MKLGIISDTHDNIEFIDSAIKKFKELNIDTIIHCGDITKPENLEKFKNFSKCYFVKGNMDKDLEELKRTAENINAKYYEDYADLTIEKKNIAVIHSDDQMKFGSLIESLNYDYIIYGHTHQPISEIVNNTHLINPGAHNTNTIAILDLEIDEVVHIDLSTGKPINKEKEIEELQINEKEENDEDIVKEEE